MPLSLSQIFRFDLHFLTKDKELILRYLDRIKLPDERRQIIRIVCMDFFTDAEEKMAPIEFLTGDHEGKPCRQISLKIDDMAGNFSRDVK
jgi:hypothetical protein